MNSKFALSFGISLMIVGILNIFFDVSNIILFGLSLSTLIFSLINMFSPGKENKNFEFLYIFPFVVLLAIFCYNTSLMNNDAIRNIVDGKITNVLTFLSFGLLFVSEFKNYRQTMIGQKEVDKDKVTQDFEYSTMILMLLNEYLADLNSKKKLMDKETRKLYDDISALCEGRANLASIDAGLLDLDKDSYTLTDFNEAYKKNNDAINYDKRTDAYDKKMANLKKSEDKNKNQI